MFADSTAPVSRIIREDEALVIVWNDGEESIFPHAWLRENAPENRSQFWSHRASSRSSVQHLPSPWSVQIEYDETLVISWAGSREVSRFSLLELRDSQPIGEGVELALAAD